MPFLPKDVPYLLKHRFGGENKTHWNLHNDGPVCFRISYIIFFYMALSLNCAKLKKIIGWKSFKFVSFTD